MQNSNKHLKNTQNIQRSRTISYDSRVPLSPHLLPWFLKACLGLVLVKSFAVCNHIWCFKVVW